MNLSSGILFSPAKRIVLTAAVAAIAIIIFLTPNFTIANAQQQLPQAGQQPSSLMPQSPTLLNPKDSFRVKLPEGWIVQDINNTGFTLAAEVLQGYGLLAQLCPQQNEEQSVSSNLSSTTSTGNRYIGSCQHAVGEVIHIIRYPNLGARLGITSDEDNFSIIENWGTLPDAILAYHLQKLQQVGYRDIKIVNSMDTTINLDNSTDLYDGRRMATTTTMATIPAEFVDITYSTNLAPNDTKRGSFMLTATVATPRNLGVMTGYSIFYEGNSTATTSAEDAATTISPDRILASPTSGPASLPPPPAKQVFDSFELVAASTAEPLTVQLTSDETEGITPVTFEFEAEISGGTAPYTIRWDFDDGSSSGNAGEEEQEENGETIEHTYDIAGMYNARVSVTDSTGRTAADTILIIVDEPPPLTAVNIISNGTEDVAPAATFEFEANVTGGVEPYTYRWNFGDGSSGEESTTQTVLHTFDTAGTYNVSVVITDNQNQIAFDNMAITIREPEQPAMEEEQPRPEDMNKGTASNDSFGLADLIERSAGRNNNNILTFGGTSAADDYDAAADD